MAIAKFNSPDLHLTLKAGCAINISPLWSLLCHKQPARGGHNILISSPPHYRNLNLNTKYTLYRARTSQGVCVCTLTKAYSHVSCGSRSYEWSSGVSALSSSGTCDCSIWANTLVVQLALKFLSCRTKMNLLPSVILMQGHGQPPIIGGSKIGVAWGFS